MSGFDLDLLADEVASLLAPLTKGLENPGLFDSFLGEIGVLDAGGDAVFKASLAAVGGFADQCRALADQSEPSFDAVMALLGSSRQAFAAARSLVDRPGGPPGGTSLGADLAEILIVSWLARRHPVARRVGMLLGLVQPDWEQPQSAWRDSATGAIRAPFRIDRLRPARLVDLVRDPVAALKAEYLNPLASDADAVALADKVFPRLQLLLADLGVVSRYGVHPDDVTALGEWAPSMAHVFMIFLDTVSPGASADAGFMLTFSPASQGDFGLVVAPFGTLTFTRRMAGWDVAAAASAGVDLLTWGRRGATVLPAAGLSAAEAALSISAVLAPPASGAPAQVFGGPDSTRLEIGGLQLKGEAHFSTTRRSLALEANVTKAVLVLTSSDGDGFTSSLLPSQGLRGELDLGIGWSTERGLTLRGGAGLEASYAVGLSVPGVTLTHVHAALRARDDRLDVELSATFTAAIGPIRASVQRIGLASKLSFPDQGGNLGFADLTLGYKPPDGAGLAIDAHGVLTGGGFLALDPASGNYGGVVQLSLHDRISLSGYGLIATKMPDGGPGFSLLVFITADGFEPVPLGFGLTLQSVGGMLAIDRTFDKEALRAGLKSDTLATLLLPRDPVSHAPALLSALAAAFPVRRGSYLLGLLARISWFTPALIELDLALVLELGARTRLLVLGRVSALLPSRENDLIRINLDAVGVLDFDERSFEADAVLVDSRIARQFPVTGSAALRARWPSQAGSGANFIMAVGGFNPRFAPPSGFPTLDRVAIALSSGTNPRLVCEAYFAITANTVQFGARAWLYAEAAGFSVTGDLGFDALVSLDPPHFRADFHGAVQLKFGSWNLLRVSLDGTLEGPVPLRLAARATIEILWFSVSVQFDFTLAGGDAGPARPSVRLEDDVRRALADPANWSTRSGLGHGVALRSLAPGAMPVLDPLGQLVVLQQVAPLNTTSDVNTYGGARLTGAARFNLTGAFDGQAGQPVQGDFAPSRYFQMSDGEKLSAPSFDRYDAGLVLGDDKSTFDPATLAVAALDYDEFVLNPDVAGAAPAQLSKPAPYRLPVAALGSQMAGGAAARSPARQAGRQRFRNPGVAPAARFNPPGWQVAQAYGGSSTPPEAPTTWSNARARLAATPGAPRWVLAEEPEF